MKNFLVAALLLITTSTYSQITFDFSSQHKLDSLKQHACLSTNMTMDGNMLATGPLQPGQMYYIETGLIDFLPDSRNKYPRIDYLFFNDSPTGNDSVTYRLILVDINGNHDILWEPGFSANYYVGEFRCHVGFKSFRPQIGGKYKVRIEFAGNVQATRVKLNKLTLVGNMNYIGGCESQTQALAIKYRPGSFRVVKRIH